MMIDEMIDDFLGAALRGQQQHWPSAWRSPETVSVALGRVRFHGIAPLLVDRVDTLDEWPAELCAAMREEARLQAFWEESHRASIARLLENLEAARVGALVMKGTALAYSVYDNPAHRRRGDTDLLIRERDLERTRACLSSSGFSICDPSARINFQETWVLDTGIGFVHELDLHWRVTTTPKLNSVFDTEECFERAVPLPRLHEHARAVDPVLTFVQCCMNQRMHGLYGYHVESRRVLDGDRLVWAWDNDLVIRSFSQDAWRDLLRICRERGLGPLCLDRINFAKRVLNGAPPAAVVDELGAMADDAGILRYIGHPDHDERFLDDLRASRGIRSTLGFIFSWIFPDRGKMRGKYPDSDKVPVFFLHCRRLSGVVARLVRRIVT